MTVVNRRKRIARSIRYDSIAFLIKRWSRDTLFTFAGTCCGCVQIPLNRKRIFVRIWFSLLR